MGTDLLEPPDNEPERLPDTIYREAYGEYLSGIALTDPERLRWSANSLDNSDFPLADEIVRDSRSLEGAILTAAAEQEGVELPTLQTAFRTCVRSYAYSGLELDADSVHLVAELLDISRTQLRRYVLPTDIMGALNCRDEPKPRQQELRRHGYNAVTVLGLGSLPVRLGIRLGVYR